MPSSKSSNSARRLAPRSSLKARAAEAKAAAARVIEKTADAEDPFEGRPCPPGFVPYPFEAPMSWLRIPGMLHAEGERLLQIAEAELQRRMAIRPDDSEAELLSRETRLHRELRIDALRGLAGCMDPPSGPLPEPGSEAAKAAFRIACTRTDQLDRQAVEGYPELQRADRPVPTWWATDDLMRALERAEIAPAECARLYPLAAEREHRIRAATLATNIGALFALTHVDQPPIPGEFAGCSMADLSRLFDAVHRVWGHATAERDAAPYCWGADDHRSAAGDVLDAASDELEALMLHRFDLRVTLSAEVFSELEWVPINNRRETDEDDEG